MLFYVINNFTRTFPRIQLQSPSPNKQLLTLVTDPRGQVQDIRSLKKQGFETDHCLSPEICFDLVRDLNGPKGKGQLEWKLNINYVPTVERPYFYNPNTPLSKSELENPHA